MELLLLAGAGLGLAVIGRLVYTSGPGVAPEGRAPRRRGLIHRLARCVLFALALALALGAGGYWGYLQAMAAQEAASPSVEQVLVLADGRRIPLVQPGDAPPPQAGASAPAATAPLRLPPARLRIPAIDLDARIVLAEADALPQAKVVAWIDGTAFTGAPGNLVLYGYRDGPYGVFLRLSELSAGDEFTVVTAGPQPEQVRYRVRQVIIVDAQDVALLAPSTAATATLITDVPGAPQKRLAVLADIAK